MITLIETAYDQPTTRRDLESLLHSQREHLLMGLAGGLHHSVCAAYRPNLGPLEEELLGGGRELFRRMPKWPPKTELRPKSCGAMEKTCQSWLVIRKAWLAERDELSEFALPD